MGINHPDTEGQITLDLLKAVNENADLTQRSLAAELGIALGLVNTYLKRCISKGYIKTRLIPRNRYAYYLTPTGFAEKSKLAAEYLHQSLSLFRQARSEYRTILERCVAQRWTKICICGCSDLAEIFILLSVEFEIEIVGIFDPLRAGTNFRGHLVADDLKELSGTDAWVLTSLDDAQQLYDLLEANVLPDRVFAPKLLDVIDTRLIRGVPQ